MIVVIYLIVDVIFVLFLLLLDFIFSSVKMEDGALEELAKNSMPCVDMEFDLEEVAYEFYNMEGL